MCVCCTSYLQCFIHQPVPASFITTHPVNQIAGLHSLSQQQTLKVCSAECLAYQSAIFNTRKQGTNKGRNGRGDFEDGAKGVTRKSEMRQRENERVRKGQEEESKRHRFLIFLIQLLKIKSLDTQTTRMKLLHSKVSDKKGHL